VPIVSAHYHSLCREDSTAAWYLVEGGLDLGKQLFGAELLGVGLLEDERLVIEGLEVVLVVHVVPRSLLTALGLAQFGSFALQTTQDQRHRHRRTAFQRVHRRRTVLLVQPYSDNDFANAADYCCE